MFTHTPGKPCICSGLGFYKNIQALGKQMQTFRHFPSQTLCMAYYTGACASIPTKINPTSDQNLFISHEAKNQNTIVYSNTQLIVI